MCKQCKGSGEKYCKTCSQTGQLTHFVSVKTSFITHTEEFVHESTQLPTELLENITFSTLFEEIKHRIAPIENFVVDEINKMSFHMVSKHGSLRPTGRIHKQKQSINFVPVFEVYFNSKYKDDCRFLVYGKKQAIYTFDKPNCCSIT